MQGFDRHGEESKGFRREATVQGVVPSLQGLGGGASQTLMRNDDGDRERPRLILEVEETELANGLDMWDGESELTHRVSVEQPSAFITEIRTEGMRSRWQRSRC